ncbi:MAG: hypothetical protein HQM09_24310 [Candidatus Riflebacteria bacterium]|nr:hypothetical protein [Candidatus Riflebacteria bacterium]
MNTPVECPYCKAEIDLSKSEIEAALFVCPACNREVSQARRPHTSAESDPVARIGQAEAAPGLSGMGTTTSGWDGKKFLQVYFTWLTWTFIGGMIAYKNSSTVQHTGTAEVIRYRQLVDIIAPLFTMGIFGTPLFRNLWISLQGIHAKNGTSEKGKKEEDSIALGYGLSVIFTIGTGFIIIAILQVVGFPN